MAGWNSYLLPVIVLCDAKSLFDRPRILHNRISNGRSCAGPHKCIIVPQIIDELIKEVFRYIEPIVLPNMLSKPRIVFIFVMRSKPNLGRPVQVSQIKWL